MDSKALKTKHPLLLIGNFIYVATWVATITETDIIYIDIF